MVADVKFFSPTSISTTLGLLVNKTGSPSSLKTTALSLLLFGPSSMR